MGRSFDVVIFDDCSGPFTPRLAVDKGLGGVEWTLMLLAEALAEDGWAVLVLTKAEQSWAHQPLCQAGWLEYDHYSRAYTEQLTCDVLVLSRWSTPRVPVARKRTVMSYHDIPARWMFAQQRRVLDHQGAVAVCVSSWLADKLSEPGIDGGDWRRRVIAPMLLDECYEPAAKDPDVFVYCSAAVKGLPESIDTWSILREHFPEIHMTRLQVATNGYDEPSGADRARMRELGVEWLGQLPARRLIAALRNAAGLFFVNSYPETHCIVASTALALGCRCHVLTLDDPAALPETLAGDPLLTRDKHAFVEQFVRCYQQPPIARRGAPDRRAAALLPAWKEVLFG